MAVLRADQPGPTGLTGPKYSSWGDLWTITHCLWAKWGLVRAQKKKSVKIRVVKARDKWRYKSARSAPIKKYVNYSSNSLGRPVNLQPRKISNSTTRGRCDQILKITHLNLSLSARSFFSLFFALDGASMNPSKHIKNRRTLSLFSELYLENGVFDPFGVNGDFDCWRGHTDNFEIAIHGPYASIYHLPSMLHTLDSLKYALETNLGQ